MPNPTYLWVAIVQPATDNFWVFLEGVDELGEDRSLW